jgi:hypothetical protein
VIPIGFRRLIALTAAYAIALQAVMAGFALVAMSAHPAPAMCAPAGGPPLSPAVPCPVCPLACGVTGLAGDAPPDFHVAALIVPLSAPACRTAAVRCVAPRLLPPSRAPPEA